MGQVSRLRVAALATLASFSFISVMAVAPPPAAAASTTLADRVIADAMTHLNAPYVWGADGPYAFDCSGLVFRVFADNGLAAMLDYSHSAYTDYEIFLRRGLASRTGGQPGDLVIYGGGAHVGIYLGGGRVISALVEGVKVTGVYALTTPFTAFLHTGLDGRAAPDASLASYVKPVARNVRITRVAANLRSAPRITSTRLAVLDPDVRLIVLRSAHDSLGRLWDEVRTPTGKVGWTANWLLTT